MSQTKPPQQLYAVTIIKVAVILKAYSRNTTSRESKKKNYIKVNCDHIYNMHPVNTSSYLTS